MTVMSAYLYITESKPTDHKIIFVEKVDLLSRSLMVTPSEHNKLGEACIKVVKASLRLEAYTEVTQTLRLERNAHLWTEDCNKIANSLQIFKLRCVLQPWLKIVCQN